MIQQFYFWDYIQINENTNWKRYLHLHVHSNNICKMDKEVVVYVYNKILFSHKNKNEELLFTTTWIHLECIMLDEITQWKTNTACSHLYVKCEGKQNERLLVKMAEDPKLTSSQGYN